MLIYIYQRRFSITSNFNTMNTCRALLGLLFFINCFCLAQTPRYFANDYGWQFIQDGTQISCTQGDSYFIAGNYKNQNLNKWGTHTLKIDKEGNMINKTEYAMENQHVGFTDMLKYSNRYILSGYCRPLQDETPTQTLFLQTSATGDLEVLKKNNLNVINSAFSIDKAIDEGFIFGGEILEGHPDTSFSNLFLAKVSEKGDYEWYKEYAYPYYCSIRKIITDDSNQVYYALASVHWVLDSGDLLLMKIDAEGNKLWEQLYDWGGEDRAKTMIRTSDGGFLISGYNRTKELYPYIMKVDSLGEVEWQRNEELFFDSATGTFLELEDGSFVLTGSKWNFPNSNDLDLEISKIDAEGNLLWQRFYGGDDDDYGYDIITANNRTDGLEGFVISGRTESLPEPGANVYLVKTNCLGLLTEPLTSFSAEQDSENSLTYHFTNHSQYVYPDSIDGGHFLWDFGDGTTSTDLHPSHEYANKGESHLVTLTAVVCSDTSVFEIKVVSGDEIVGIEGVDGLPAFSFNLYPNPNNGKVFFDYDLPKEGLLELYDLQGRLMDSYQLLMNNSEMVLGLEDFVEGMYLYRLSSEGRILKSGKILFR